MKISNEVKIGLIALVALGCFLYGFNYLKGIDYFTSQQKFHAEYTDVDGLVEANPLIINGYIVGLVSNIELSNDIHKRVMVTMLLDDEIKIPINTVAKIVSSDIMGSKAIRLELGDSMEIAVDGDTLESDNEENLKESVNKMVRPLQQKAENLISSIDSVMTVVTEVLDKDARKNLSNSFKSIDLALQSLERTAHKLDTLVESEQQKMTRILSNVEVLTSTLADNKENLDNALKNFSNISDSLSKANITALLNNINNTLAETAAIMKTINSGKGSIGKLVHNDSLYANLNNSARDLQQLLEDVKENPKRYVHFSLIERKDKSQKKSKSVPENTSSVPE